MSAIFISHSTKDNADAAAMGAWLEDQGHKSYFIDYDGISAGTDWEQVLYQRLRQCQAIVALVTPDWLESKWCFAEMIQAREKGKPIFPVIAKPCQLPDLLSDTQKIDLVADPEGGYRRLALGLRERGLEPTDVWNPERAPYPGLPSFQEEDAAVFFGRSAEILELRETLEALRRHNQDVQRFVLILGSSGSGKSSLVRAGLIPSLKKDKENWLPIRPFRPQDEPNPIDSLTFAIADTYKELGLPCDSDLLRSRFRSAAESTPVDSGELLKIARELSFAVGRRDATVIITVDQTEELFGSAAAEPGKSFLRLLGASLSAGDRHLMALATLRSDFLGTFQNQVASQEEEIRLGLNHVPWTVDPIPIERYADLIEGPARRAGLVLEDNLVLKLVQDAGQPDSLPLLAFILRRLYDLHFGSPQADRQTTLRLRDYDQLGGLPGAVQNAADRILKDPNLTENIISQLRRAFIPGLVRDNDEGSYSRRRAFLNKLPLGSLSLLEKFVQARLLVKDKDGEETVEIAHEALLRTWPTLTAWLGDDRDKLRQHSFIIRAANEWNEKDRSDDYLVHRDSRLTDAQELVSEHRFAFLPGSAEHAYLDACVVNQQAREAAAQEERERKLRDAEQLAKEKALLAQTEKERAAAAERAAEAERQAKTNAEGRELAEKERAAAAERAAEAERQARTNAEGRELAEKERAAAAERATEAERQARTNAEGRELAEKERAEQAEKAAREQTEAARKLRRRAWILALVAFVAIAAGGLAVLGLNSALTAEKRTREVASQANVSLARYSYEGGNYAQELAYLAKALKLNPRNFEAAALTAALLTQESWPVVTGAMKHDGQVLSAQFSADGQRVVTASVDKTARVWEAATGKALSEPMKHDDVVTSAQFSADGQRVVTASVDKTARVWEAATGKALSEPMKHDDVVTSAQFSADGQRVVTASWDKTARVWEAATGKALSEPMKHDDVVYSAQFSADGQRVVTASRDKTARVWEAATGKALSEPMKHDGQVLSAQFSADGQRVVTASVDKTARVWEAATGKALSEPMKHDDVVTSAQFSADGQRVVTASADKTARVWEAATGKALSEPMKHDDVVTSAQFSADGQRVVTASWDKTARVWEAATGKALSEPMKHDDVVLSGQFSADGQRVVTASWDKTARVWEAATGKALSEPMKHDDVVTSAQFSADGQRVVTASRDKTARVWKAATGKALSEPMKHDGQVLSAQFSADGQRVVTASYDGTARVWEATTGKALSEPMKHDDVVTSAQFSADGQRVVTASADKTARVWEAATGKALSEPMKHDDVVTSAQFSADGQRVVTASADKTARVWEAATGKALSEPMKHDDLVTSAQFSADGQRVLTASRDKTARVWEAATGKALSEPMKHDDVVTSAQFSADGQRVVTASADKTARVWEAATGKALSEPMKHDDLVTSAQFSADGQRVVTASSDNTARVWDAATGKALSEPMKHDGWVWSAQFSADGQRVVTASGDKTARVWDIPTITGKDSVDDANLLADLAEATGGVALQAFGQTEILAALTPDQRKATRDKIAAKFAAPSLESTPLKRYFPEELTALQRFLRWSVSGAKTRTISPFSDLTVADWVKNRIQEGTLDDLRAAIFMDPANARLAAYFGLALANLAVAEKADPDDARRARAEADYQTHRAVKLASDNDEVKNLRTEVVKLLQLSSN